MPSRKVALVAWELGAGPGHLEHLRPIVAALLGRGWTVIAAMRDLAGGHAVLGSIDPALRKGRFAVGQAPIFLHRATPYPGRPSSMAEILAHSGFADAAALRPVVDTWDRMLDAIKPNIIVADFSPSVVAAARDRIPVIMTGNGWTISPAGSPVPPLPIKPYDAAAAAEAEDRICSAVEQVSRAGWRPRSFAHLLRGDTRFIYTSALLDPYRASRQDRLSWPPNLVLPQVQDRRGGAGEAIVYLPRHHAAMPDVLGALASTGFKTLAYLGGMQPVAPDTVQVSTQPLDFGVVLPNARFVIHHGGLGVANWCVAYRRPQIIIPRDLEKHLIAHAIETSGGGISVSPAFDSTAIARAIHQAMPLCPCAPVSSGMLHGSPDETIEAIVEACEQ